MASIIAQEVPLYAIETYQVILAGDAFLAVIVEAIMALMFIHGVIMILAFLLPESHEGRHHKNCTDDQSNNSEPE